MGYLKKIVEDIGSGKAVRASVTELKQILVGALPAILDDKQQSKKVSNILRTIKREDTADVGGTGHSARWYLKR